MWFRSFIDSTDSVDYDVTRSSRRYRVGLLDMKTRQVRVWSSWLVRFEDVITTFQEHSIVAISVSFLSSTPSWITPLHTDWSCFERLSTLSQPLHTRQYITTVHPRHWVVGQWYGAESFLNLNHYSCQCRHRRAGHVAAAKDTTPRGLLKTITFVIETTTKLVL